MSKNFSPEEAGRYLGSEEHPVPVATLAWWRCKGKGPDFMKIGARVIYTGEQLDAYKARQTRSPELRSQA